MTADHLETVRETLLRSDGTPIDKVLTPREWKVMKFAVEGLKNKEIALRLSVTEGTAKCHLHSIYRKLGINNRTALASLVFQQSSTRRRA